MRDWAANGSEVFPVDIVHDVVRAIVEATQLYAAFPSCGVESVIHLLVLADDVGFGQIETNVVERAQILTAGKTLLLIKLQPLLETLFVVGREIETAMFLDQGRAARTACPLLLQYQGWKQNRHGCRSVQRDRRSKVRRRP